MSLGLNLHVWLAQKSGSDPKTCRRSWWNPASRRVVLRLPAASFIHHSFKRLEIISLPSSTNAPDITQGKEKWKTFSLVRRNHLFEMVSSASPRRNYAALPRLVSSSSSECRVSIFGFPRKQLRLSARGTAAAFCGVRVKVGCSGEKCRLSGWAWLWKMWWKWFFLNIIYYLLPAWIRAVGVRSDASSALWFETPSTELPDEEILLLSLIALITGTTDPFYAVFYFSLHRASFILVRANQMTHYEETNNRLCSEEGKNIQQK